MKAVPPKKEPLHLDNFDRFEDVLSRIDLLIAAEPENGQHHYNKGAWLLSSGHFEEGWPELEYRMLMLGVNANYALFPIPIWENQSIEGKNLFIWLEQGIGDQIQVMSMVPDLFKLGARKITVYCNRRLMPLFRRSFPAITFVDPSDDVYYENYDYQLSYSGVGLLVRKSFSDFSGQHYLVADPSRVAEMRARYERFANGRKIVGVSWSSWNPRIGEGKSIHLNNFLNFGDDRDTFFVSLQYKPRIPSFSWISPHIDQYFDQMWDLDGFAAQVAAMDAVVSVSNSTLHMAGALGVPTLGMLPHGGCRNWYWFNQRTDCPWYASVELTRQEGTGDWTGPGIRAREFMASVGGRDVSRETKTPEAKPDEAKPDELTALRLRVKELEEAMIPLVPYAECDNYTLTGQFLQGQDRGRQVVFARKTLYQDMGIFLRMKHLLANPLLANSSPANPLVPHVSH